MSNSEFINGLALSIDEIKHRGLYRDLSISSASLDFTSNDYLGLRTMSGVSSLGRVVGASASRVLSGTSESHFMLEEGLARYFGVKSALLFGSGYLANLGTLSALISRRDIVLSDKFCHRSLLEGAHLSCAEHKRFRHNDMTHLEDILRTTSVKRSSDQRIFIVTESVFSMDGDLAPLREMQSLCKKYEAMLIVDEAHALGVFGDSGRGRCSEEEITGEMLAILGTASKSLCGYGGFFLGNQIVKEYLINKSSSFIYSTALPPILCDSILANLNFIETLPNLGKSVLENADFFRSELARAGAYDYCILLPESRSQIVPLILGDENKVIRLRDLLKLQGVSIAVIRPPSVPEGTSRIRFSIRADHEREDLRRLAYLVAESLKGL